MYVQIYIDTSSIQDLLFPPDNVRTQTAKLLISGKIRFNWQAN